MMSNVYYNYEVTERDLSIKYYVSRKEIAQVYNIHINTVSNHIKKLVKGLTTVDTARNKHYNGIIIKKVCILKPRYIMLD